jgi:signal transduction histidine kinase
MRIIRRLWHFQSPHLGALSTALAVLAVLSVVWWRAGQWYAAQLLAEQRGEAAVETSLRGNALTASLNRRLARLQGLQAFVQAELPGAELSSRFQPFAAELYAGSVGIRSLAVAPMGVVRYVYPLAGNESLLGYDSLEDPRPEVRADTQRAIDTREIVLSGPSESIHGGQGLVARQAVYQGEMCWGLVSVSIDFPTLLAEADLIAESGDLDFALRDSYGQVFFGLAAYYESDPVVSLIKLPDTVWELAGVPAGGWETTIAQPLLVFRSATAIIVGLLAGLTYLTVNRQRRLALAVQQRTEEIAKASELLEQRVEQRTHELSTLLEVSRNVTSTLDLQPLLALILDQLKTVVNYTGAAIIAAQGDEYLFLRYQGPVPWEQILGLRISREQMSTYRESAQGREFVIIDDIWGTGPAAQIFMDLVGEAQQEAFRHAHAWLGVPLLIKERLIGLLHMDHGQPGFFSERHGRLALTIAGHVATAIENAQLYQQAQRLAVLEERQRLARELHDSVSQALYGIALGARTARTLLERDASQSAEPLDYVLSLADAGLAEMRALIFELRPDSLEKEGLVVALTKQAAAVQARHGLAVQTALGAEPDTPFEAKEALYRVAQEALNNTVKHAQASQVTVRLVLKDKEILLEIRDDGVGFDPAGDFRGHLGLLTMRERMARLGGTLTVDSAAGKGTCVQARVPWRENQDSPSTAALGESGF